MPLFSSVQKEFRQIVEKLNSETIVPPPDDSSDDSGYESSQEAAAVTPKVETVSKAISLDPAPQPSYIKVEEPPSSPSSVSSSGSWCAVFNRKALKAKSELDYKNVTKLS